MRARRSIAVLAVLAMAACDDGAPPPDSAATGDSLLGPGQELYWEGAYDSARAVWRDALDRVQTAGDSAGAADLLTWMGLAAMRSGDYGTARSEGEAALELKLTLGRDEKLPRSYNALGLLALSEDRLMDALRLFDRTREAALAVPDERMAAAAAGNAGLIHAYLGDLEQAADLLRRMHEGAVAVGDTVLQANALTNLAMVEVWSGDPAAALEPLEEARRLYDETGYALGAQYALGQLATAFSDMGRYREAMAAMDTALALARRNRIRDQEAENHRILGSIFADLGDHRRALRHYGEAAAIAGELAMSSELGTIARNAALAHLALGSNGRALEEADRALTAHRTAGEPFEELDDLLVMARIQQRMGDGDGAQESLRSARLVARALDAGSAQTAVALAEARNAESRGAPRRVLEAVVQGLEVAAEADARALTRIHGFAARAYGDLGRLDSAAAEGLAAVRALDRVRGDLGSAELRGTFTAASAELYGDVVLILLRGGRTGEAFQVADRARSRELVRHLTALRSSTEQALSEEAAPGGQQDLAAAELLLRRIDALLAELQDLEQIPPGQRGPGAAATSAEIRSRVDRLRDRYESLAMRMARAEDRSVELLAGRAASEARVRGALAPDEALLHYTLTREELVIFVARSDRFQTARVPVSARDLGSRVRLLRSLWGTRGAEVYRGLPVAQALHEILIRPAADTGLLDGAKRLLIVPHGVLEQLPFPALHDAATGRYLIQDHAVAYAPSASAVPALRGSRTGPLAGGAAAFAPFPDELPGTRREAVAARQALPDSRLNLGRQATESATRNALADREIVHIASHGILSARNPMFSRIRLAPGPGTAPADDGRLEVHEVLKLPVRSSLVVLSGCETGLAEEWSGDPLRPVGFATLAQAFLQAGAENVLATLWRIHDIGSAELVRRFYRRIDRGDPTAALATAQREMIQDPQYRAPYYWAGFALMGRGPIDQTEATQRFSQHNRSR